LNFIKKFYNVFCKIEEFIVGAFVAFITFLVFASAVGRCLKFPINWAQDVSLLLFSWVVFLGADLALRKADFVRVDMLVTKFPVKVQKILYYIKDNNYPHELIQIGIIKGENFFFAAFNFLEVY
jgi:TRAP-type C4-dicarboxylate transport system permease small subunit